MSDSTDTAPRKMFAIMRLGKISSTTVLRHVSNHNTRAVMSENVEQDGPAPIELLEDGSDDFVASAAARMAELGIDPATTKGKIIAVEAVVSASRAWFAQATDAETAEWKRASVAWANQLFGRGLLTAKLHEDEEVPHIHFVAIPAVQKKRLRRGPKPKSEEARRQREEEDARAPLVWTLAYHDILGGKSDRLSQEQDTYHGFVRHLGLERGEKQQEATTIAMGDELSIEVGDLARGVDADGKARPRRSLTPKQYRARIKQLDAEAAAVRAEAERDRADAAAAKDNAAAASRAAEAKLDAATATSAVADAGSRALAGDRRVLELDREALDGRMAAVALRERDVQAAKNAVDIARREVARQRDDLTISLAAAAHATDIARDKAIAAARATAAANADREAAARLIAQAQADRAAIADERARRESELALLMKASNDANGLDLRAVDNGITMNEAAMSEPERETYRRPWPAPVRVLAMTLAKALDRVRELARSLRDREQSVAAKELAVKEQEQANACELEKSRAAQRVEHQQALDALVLREEAAKAAKADADRHAEVADGRMKAAVEKENAAIAALDEQARWAKAVDMIGRYPFLVIHGNDGGFRFDHRPERTGRLPQWLTSTLQQPVPAWAMAAIKGMHRLELLTEGVEAREREAAYHVEQLKEMIAAAGLALQPAQQEIVTRATSVIRQVGPALQRRDGELGQ